ncbi:hypothetical protein ACIQXF_03200 [Lysinibacillus sp. NPDC097231]|uniref:hypothetical protein n=1 Tax=Lysinibacillus sp. NPDC097231 TaxID=3364142 RepID=UPI00382C8E03
MAYIHEFGIVTCIEKDKNYVRYEPENYNCIGVDGDLFDELFSKDFGKKMHHLETFAHNTNRPFKSLAYCGITLIPPSSQKQFLNMVSEANNEYKSEELEKLMKKIAAAIKEDKWMIHFGV